MARPGDRSRAAPWLVLVAVAWAWGRSGGSGGADLLILLGLLVAALAITWWTGGPAPWPASGSVPRRRSAGSTSAWSALLATALGWMVVRGLLDGGSVRLVMLVPSVWLASWLLVLVLERAALDANEQALTGLVVLGTVHATLVVPEWIRLLRAGAVDPTGLPRAGSALLADPNALGALLVATSLVTVRLLVRTPLQRWAVLALAVQLLGVLGTGSRYAVSAALLLGGWRLRTVLPADRRRSRAVLGAAAGWALLAVLVLGLRARWFVHEPRVRLWQAAWRRIERHPWAGSGPVPEPYPVAGIRMTTHAHDEVLQLAVDYGLPLVLVLLLVALVVASRTSRLRLDPWLASGAAVAVGSGMVDYSLRLPVVALVAAWLGESAYLAVSAPGARRVVTS